MMKSKMMKKMEMVTQALDQTRKEMESKARILMIHLKRLNRKNPSSLPMNGQANRLSKKKNDSLKFIISILL